MTNAPETRKTHVIRIVFTNRAGEILQDKWVDVERIDVMKNTLPGASSNYQGLERHFKWMDDPNKDDYDPNGNPSRKVKIVKVCSPDEDNVEDPEEWAEIPVIKRIRVLGSDKNYQGKAERFINAEIEQSRKVKSRKILHHDTNIDDEAEAAFDADPELKVYVVPGKRYEKIESTKDEDQFVEHEVPLYLKHRGNYSYNEGDDGDYNQGRQTKLLNQYQIDESEPAEKVVVGPDGFNPPYRLDPYQQIINVNLGNLAVEFLDGIL